MNVDRSESKVERLSRSDVVAWWGPEKAHEATDPETMGRLARRYRSGLELTGMFLALVAACLAAECFLSNRRREATPVETREAGEKGPT